MNKTPDSRATVEAWLRSGRSVCPFAARSVSHLVEIPIVPRRGRAALLETLPGFVTTSGATPPHALLVVGPPKAALSFSRCKSWAQEGMLELIVSFSVFGGADAREAERVVMLHDRPAILDEASTTRVMLSWGDEPLYCVGFAPLYPEDHPRWAPVPLLLVTWMRDIARAQPAVPRIREEAHRRHGEPYDADELMLPVPARKRAGGGRC